MTNQQGAPEALRPIARYKIGYHTDEWGMRSSTPSGIPDHAGAWVRYEDHIAALVGAQQPAPSAAAHKACKPDMLVNGGALKLALNVLRRAGKHEVADELEATAQPTPTPQADSQPAPQQEARPVTPYTCPKCHALWLHWPAEQSGFGMDTLNCRSTTHCDYCENGGVEQLERLERVPAALKAPQQEAQEPVGYTHASWIAEAKRGGGGSFVGRKNAAFDVPIYTAPQPSPAAQGDALDAARYRFLAGNCRSTSEHWGGRWSIIVDGPAPKSHDSEDDFDAAIDAARKQGANHD